MRRRQPADVFVAFGITGDLAKVMTFRSLYRLEKRGLLDCPVVGVAVDDWTVDQLVERARESIVGTGEELDEAVFKRFAARLQYVSGDFGDAATYERVGKAIDGAKLPVFYLEIPPFLFGRVVQGLSEAGLTQDRANRRREAVRARSRLRRRARRRAAPVRRRVAALPDRPLPREDGPRGDPPPSFRERDARAALEPQPPVGVEITMAESFGVEDRGHFYDPVGALRDVVVNHLMQVVAACAMEAPSRGDPRTIKDAQVALFRGIMTADPAHYVRGQYDGYQKIDGVKPGSTTETYAALRLEIENWRWAGVPFFIRTGKRLPVTQTELRLVFKRPPQARLRPREGPLGAEPARRQARPHDRRPPDRRRPPRRPGRARPRSSSTWSSARRAARARRRTRCCFTPRWSATRPASRRMDSVEEAWRVMAPLLESPPPVQPVRAGKLGAGGGRRPRRGLRRGTHPGSRADMDAYDVVIVGTGAGGGTLARHLAPSGKRILLLERGDWLRREPANWSVHDVFVDNRYISEDTWYDPQGKAFQPQIHYFVGGATKLYGAALYRLRKEDFGELRHHDGISPAWPISYDELEPYYTQAEHLYEVHGARGEDPTEPPTSAPYPFPPVSHEPRIQRLADQLEAAGLHPFHAPCGIRLNEANLPYSACVRCVNCDGFPCLVHGKSDAEVMGVRPALEHANVTLLTGAKAVKLETNESGTEVTAVVVERDGETERYSGDLVVLACGAANTAALLLRSAERQASERARERLRPGGQELHVPREPGRARALPR